MWLVDKAVLPIENSVGGSIHRNYDLLLRHRLHIVGEVQLTVNHCLLGLPGIRKEDLKRVLSHPLVSLIYFLSFPHINVRVFLMLFSLLFYRNSKSMSLIFSFLSPFVKSCPRRNKELRIPIFHF